MNKKIKCNAIIARLVTELVVDLSFLGVEGEVREEDLIQRARDLMRSGGFKEISSDWRNDAWDNDDR